MAGYNFKYGSTQRISDYATLTPEEQAGRDANKLAISRLAPPMSGSPKQLKWAIDLFEGEQYHWHHFGYSIANIDLFFTTPEARSASWWITTCKDNHNGMGGDMRIALDAILDRIKQPGPTPATLSLKLKVGYPNRKVA